MTDRDLFDRSLGRRIGEHANAAVRPFDAAVIARDAMRHPGRRGSGWRSGIGRWRPSDRPMVLAILLGGTLIAATGVALTVGGQPSPGPMTSSLAGPVGAVLADGRVLVVGHDSGGGLAELWDPASGKLSAAGSLHQPGRTDLSVLALPDGDALVASAPEDLVGDARLGIWHHETLATEPIAVPSDVAGWVPVIVLADGRVLGSACADQDCLSERALALDPVSGIFDDMGALDLRATHAFRLVNGHLLLIGTVASAIRVTEWDPTAPAGTPRRSAHRVSPDDHAMDPSPWEFHPVQLADERVAFLYWGLNVGPERVPVWDPVTRSFSDVPLDVGVPRAAVSLPDGRVLVLSDGPAGAAARIWDWAAGTVTDGPSLTPGRSSAAIVGLPDGRVLLVGGRPEDDPEWLRSAEIYEP